MHQVLQQITHPQPELPPTHATNAHQPCADTTLARTIPAMTTPACPFCTHVLSGNDRPHLEETANVIAFEDAYPSAPGHTLIIPRRHVGHILDLTDAEHTDLWTVARNQLARLSNNGSRDHTIGINDGPLAGQTVPHVHLHIIPRHEGDTAEARGGIRWAIPETAAYWQP